MGNTKTSVTVFYDSPWKLAEIGHLIQKMRIEGLKLNYRFFLYVKRVIE